MIPTGSPSRIGVFLPHGYFGGTLRLWLNVVRHVASRLDGLVVAGVLEDHRPRIRAELATIEREFPRADIRSFRWRVLDRRGARTAVTESGVPVGRWMSADYQVPSDGDRDFLDCDFWLFVSDRLDRPLVPARPYGILVTDHLQRYVPEIFDGGAYADSHSAAWNFLRNVRNADLVVATSRDTAQDVAAYAGALGRILRLPMAVDVDHFLTLQTSGVAAGPRGSDGDYFVWVTNASPHKNHLRMLHALRHYYEELGGGLDTVVTGLGTECFDSRLGGAARVHASHTWDHPHVRQVRELLDGACAGIRQRIHLRGLVPDSDYVRVVAGARFLAHNVLADNGTFSVVEAALLGRKAVSSDYPQMREIDESFGLGLRFFDPFDVAATARAIRDAELYAPLLPAGVVDRIREHDWRRWDGVLTTAIADIIGRGRTEVACL